MNTRRVFTNATRRARVLDCCRIAALAAGLALPGCVADGTAISTDKPAPVKAEFETSSFRIVSGRYLLLPVHAAQDKLMGPFILGSYSFSGSSWSGMGFAKGYEQTPALNLHVVDLVEKRDCAVFDRQVALAGWGDSFDEQRKLVFADTLILIARTADTNRDQKIDDQDEVCAFAFELSTRTLRRLLPEGFSVGGASPRPPMLLLTLRATADGTVAVYECDPLTGTGAFVVRGLKP